MNLEESITSCLKANGAASVYFTDISGLPEEQNKGFSRAVIFTIPLSPQYIRKVTGCPDYVQEKIHNSPDFSDDELYLTELKTDRVSDSLSDFFKHEGFSAYSHSDKNQIETGFLTVFMA
ncbi:hypothetical protein K7I13_08905 [Brucepastera parasyntrophica]|uniref:hypothetical protein n=1 Tax=Brucepastera parasyntrophica TaxID=2880008 RepID=UPI00210B2336|nr:hypothetical protein [Brucepastera parasyntrophica]ULQ58676.1 hypothetical protein K7I13_08905 [Brucepastera parasyntrophica]